ncbi:glycosyl transferase family 10 (putative fucosyltransferase) [Litoreibacter halocynthiae]|uniref:Glycosyl transferase family 10 (Putative fucosyltransferase) n=1 Tax=Litoreibacter halocynthiae TaxID=1242689 RepID=A0A4R7LI63_9RHOB|nr:glycosyltransferase family 10 [Litoreibacter halocynthiae]TDT75174.1 glycosyl transferase family 10 (putative fucosyltransferase) [Litoreibacter halocynthiae]
MTGAVSAVAVVPYGCWPTLGIAKMSLDDLVWPLGRPDRLSQGTVSDLGPDDHLITFPRKPMFYLPWPGVRAKVSVMIVEPDVVHGHHLKNARRMRWRFHHILTKNKDLLAGAPNALHYVFGFTFIDDIDSIVVDKTRMTSLIASAKRDLEGHKLRHQIVDHVREAALEVDVMGRGYKPFERKQDGLAPYRYSVVIENIRERDYFTEKMVDAALCETVPIYWGCPNIETFFNPAGMMICQSEAEIRDALQRVSVEDYAARRAAITENAARARFYADYLRRAALTVQSGRPCTYD